MTISIETVTKKLMEDFKQADLPEQSKAASPYRPKAGKNDVAHKPSYDKVDPTKKNKPNIPSKMNRVNKTKSSGPEKTPTPEKIKGNTTMKAGKQQSADLSVKSSSNSKSHFTDAGNIDRSGAEPVKWHASTDSSTKSLMGKCLQGCDPKSVKKISFSVKMPSNVDFGIVPTGSMIPTKHDHKTKEASSQPLKESRKPKTKPKLVSENVINGTVIVKIGERKHVFEAATIPMINNMAKNYSSVGQPISIDVRSGLRKSYSDKKFVTSIMEAIHAKVLDVDHKHKKSLKESLTRFTDLLEDQYIPFHNKSKRKWFNECVKPAFRQAYRDFKEIYESFMTPYEVTIKVQSKDGIELVDVLSKGINEHYAAFNAVEEVLAESSASTRVLNVYVGKNKLLAEDVQSLHTKSLSFDDMPDKFQNAGFGLKVDTKRHEPSAPAVKKKEPCKGTRPSGVDKFSVGSKSSNPESLANKTGARHKDVTGMKRKPAKDSGPRFPE